MTSLLSPTLLLSVMAGGVIGGLMRMWVGSLVTHVLGSGFPWGTLVVNLSGALVIGVLAGVWIDPTAAQPVVPWHSHWTVLVAGLLGSYTTVSSFSLQTLELIEAGRTSAALANVAGSLVLCLGGAAAAFLLTHALLGG